MKIIEQYVSFHDWYLLGIAADMDKEVVELRLMFDNKKDRVRLLFGGATRCWANDFLIQNIVYSIKVLTDFNSDEYRKALASLDKAYSWGKGKPLKNIAVLEATLGAELLIEFDSLEVEPESSV
ncbi:hypothetical protein HDG34_002111 [Paraburkholderia sp. HC6.4b]|uniref:hypothetical protein n=1 Tax=unclassified Paraburkholderia TaxID=2615204 RepID=UPI001621D889|nr:MULTISPECIES: hypothetical protein [unclassified Paraburkholderia]MBB5408179.1 hypothetical protein [Paraburkholderia sp. HC6.4b]MBB5453170.1 hypothetical protein [Paraburkholderia sp. Kb1A]